MVFIGTNGLRPAIGGGNNDNFFHGESRVIRLMMVTMTMIAMMTMTTMITLRMIMKITGTNGLRPGEEIMTTFSMESQELSG